MFLSTIHTILTINTIYCVRPTSIIPSKSAPSSMTLKLSASQPDQGQRIGLYSADTDRSTPFGRCGCHDTSFCK